MDHGYHKVEGWVNEQVPQMLDLLETSKFNYAQGGVAEIGVHHGRMYILLNQTTSRDARSYAIDIFDEQYLNIDRSGKGWLDKFKSNLMEFDAHRGSNTTIIRGDSTDHALRLEEEIEPGCIKYFSIDGGHTVEHTTNDLHLANRLIANSGVVILDDILNAGWLGVIEGAVRFLMTAPTLVPFAIGGNKLYLAKLSYYAHYFSLVNDSKLKTKIVKFVGRDIVKM